MTSSPSATAHFPDDFAWGTGLCSLSWEGAASEDGKGASVWDLFARKPGAIWGGATPDVAADGYHRYAEDVRLMQRFGMRAHNLSISWPRVLPEGAGAPNHLGLAFYDRLIDALLEADVEPWVTLFTWDYPAGLQYRGGWLNRDSSDWFADYATLIVERLSDRVHHWITMVEPQSIIGLGYGAGVLAPGLSLPLTEQLLAGHNLLLSHGKAVQAIRAGSTRAAKIGYAPICKTRMPLTDSTEDLDAARHAMFGVFTKDLESNTWWSDPVFLGRYPEDGWELFAADLPAVGDGDMETIAQPLDFYGPTVHSGHYVRATSDGYERVPHPVDVPLNSLGWPIRPEICYYGPRLLYERYGTPIVIVENGLSTREWVSPDGAVHDPQRIDFTRDHLLQLDRAIAEGVPVNGYFHWTWIDNFECSEGYKDRFGLVHCDFQTLERTPKDSAYWYAEVIRTNGATLYEDRAHDRREPFRIQGAWR